jgi:diguanylate cyclase (GGDEF)-like protein/PAS domain S-box-containing protein
MTRDSSLVPSLSSGQILDTVAAIASQGRAINDLDVLLHQATDQVRQLLHTDRVVLYRFLPNQDALIAVESLASPWIPLQGQLIYDPCFENGWGDRYNQGHISVIDDVQNSALEPCYIELLTRLQVQATVAVPVFCGATLWALLIVHHCHSPRVWGELDIQLVTHMASQLGQAVYQHQLQQQLATLQQPLQQPRAVPGSTAAQERQTNALFQLFTENIDQVLFVRDGQSGQFLYVSPAYERIWQRPCESLYADSNAWLATIHPDDLPQVHTSLESQFGGNSVTREYRIVRPDGDLRWIRAQVYVVDGPNQASQMVGWAEDCTARKQLELDLTAAQVALQRRVDQEQLLRSITTRMRSTLDFETILATTAAEVRAIFEADRAVIYQLSNDGHRQVVQQAMRPPYAAIDNGLLLLEALPSPLLDTLHQGQPYVINTITDVDWPGETAVFLDSFQVKSAMVAAIVLHNPDHHVAIWGVLTIHVCDRPRQWQATEAEMLQHVADQLAIAIHQAELYQQLQTANQDLNRLAKTDGLTQLANRRWLDHYLQQEWQRLARQHHPLSVVLADVDYFKPYNDTYGHAAGDQCLIDIAGAIQAVIKRPADLVARYGGEEFAIVLPDTDAAGALRVVELVRQTLQERALPHAALPAQPLITLSFGIATLIPEPGDRFDQIMRMADEALYSAKGNGRNRYHVFGTAIYGG